LNTLLFLPFVSVFAKFIEKIIPGTPVIEERGPIYLDERMFESPAVALSLATKEIIRMAKIAGRNLEAAMKGFYEKDEKKLETVFKDEDLVDELERAITVYLAKLSQKGLTPDLSKKHTGLLHTVKDFERVGDHAENIAELAMSRIEENLPYSDYAIMELENMYRLVYGVFKDALDALQNEDKEKAVMVTETEPLIDKMEKLLRESHLQRLNKGICYPVSGVIFLDIVSNLERIGDHCNNIAHIVINNF